MSLQDYYEDSFKSERGRSPSDMKEEVLLFAKALANYVIECKGRFLPHKDWHGLNILEMGSGRGGLSLQLARMGARVTLVDFSPTALAQAEALFASEGFEIKTIAADVTHPDVVLPEKYDLVVDSHLLHCLTSDPERLSYLQLVWDHLTNNGIFVAETMVHRKKLFIPNGFMFDQNNTLWQMFGEWKPVRRILDSLDLEQELLAARFHIIYFYYYGQFGFIPHKNFMDLPSEILPAAVRFVVQKNSDTQDI
jgi:2-polyprenyl-3-methyl-5-hydroxy-6-metoxy-1,4-benzoquinol methylase